VNHRLIGTAVLACCVGWCVASAHGQRAQPASINRPSSWAPSARIGLVGGYNTGRYATPEQVATLPPDSFGSGGRGLGRPNFLGAGWRMGSLPAPAVPQAFTLAQPGAIAPMTTSPFARALRGAQAQDLALASRLESSLQLSVPLTGIGTTEIEWPDRPYFIPEPTGTAFQKFFGLKPTVAEPVAELPMPEEGWVGLLEQQNDESLRLKRQRALEEFKAATRERSSFEQLSEAQWALRVLRDLDRETYIPCLLLVHVALEKRQLSVAVTHLADAVRRHPELFVERPDLASYFGDPTLLERVARDHLKIGDEDPSPVGYVLQAYCAWVLNDRVRARDALDKMAAEDSETEMTRGLSSIRDALAVAVK
jgi:hypothetical protein